MEEEKTMQALKVKIKELENVIASLTSDTDGPIILTHVALDSLLLGYNCTVTLNNCSVGYIIPETVNDLDFDEIECKLGDIHSQLQEISGLVTGIKSGVEDINASIESK